MRITATYSDGGVSHALDVAIDALSDLTPIFRIFLGWLRPQIQGVFDQQGPGWAPLKESSKQQRARTLPAKISAIRARALNPLQRSVLKSYRRAKKRADRTALGSKLYERRQRTLIKQERQAAEIESIQKGAAPTGGREFAKLGQRVSKYRASAEDRIAALERGDVLGRIASSIKATIAKGELTIESAIDWAGIHNDGGTAGKGARIPERKFLEWTPERIDKFIEIATQYIADKMNKAA